MKDRDIKEQICEIGRRIYDRGMVASNDGNISVRIADNEILCTPTGVSKGFMTPECICRIDARGNVLESSDGYRPSSEMKMHLRVYEMRKDAKAVVHTHAKYATCFAINGRPLNRAVTSEAVVMLGCVPLAPFATPSTNEVPDSIEPYLENWDAVLLENHGALTWSEDLLSAYMKMESLEYYAELLYKSEQLGQPRGFSKEQIEKLAEVRQKMGLTGGYPAGKITNNCYKCDKCIWKA